MRSDEIGSPLFPAAPPLAVTRLADVERRLDECEEALRFTEEENLRLNDEAERLRNLLGEVAASGVAFQDDRLDYVEVQVDVDTWRNVKGLA
jgi:hypothetical protein